MTNRMIGSTRSSLAIMLVAGSLMTVGCVTNQEEEALTSDEFLATLEPEAGDAEPIVGSELDSDDSGEKPVEDFAIAKDYESFDPDGIRIKFDFDSAELTAENTAALDKIVNGLKKDPLAKIFVRGHADKQGPEAYNDYLSQKRANVIHKYLTSNGVDENRLIMVHLGESEPLVDGNNVAAYKKNRRGDFHLDYSDGAFQN